MRRLNYEKNDLGYSFAIATTVMVAASLVLGLIFGVSPKGFYFWLMQALYALLIGSSAVLYAAISKTTFLSATKLNKRPILSHVLWGCGAVVFLICYMSQINNLFLDLLEKSGLNRPSVELEDNVVGLILCACILPALTEEVVFRGTVAQSLYGCKSKLAALCISGALFSIFHANPAQTLHQFVLGALLTLLVFRSGSLWTGVIVHFFNNAFVVAMAYTPFGSDEYWSLTDNPKFALPIMIVGIVGFVVCVIVYVKTTRSNWQKPAKVEVDETDDEIDKETEQEFVINSHKASNGALVVGVFVCAMLWVAQLLV